MKTKLLSFITQVVFLTSLMCLSVFPISCKASVSGLEIIGKDCSFPTLENYQVIDSRKITMTFSDKVSLVSGNITKESITRNVSVEEIPIIVDYSTDQRTITINLEDDTEIGQPYIFTGKVENNQGSSLTFSFKFSGFNNELPVMLLTEIMDGNWNKKIYEFVEFLVLSDGNLAGLKLSSINDGEVSDYYFPPLKVKSGDYVTVHFRNPDLESQTPETLFVNEINGNISEAKGFGTSDKSWDLFANFSDSCLGASQDIILLENTNNGSLLQCLAYSKDDKTSWSKTKYSDALTRCFEEGLWLPDDSFESAFLFKTSAVIRRKESVINTIKEKFAQKEYTDIIPSDSSQWERITNSQISPGM